MSWSYSLGTATKDPSNANILLTFNFTSSDGQSQTRIVPSSTWAPSTIAAHAQGVILQLEARDEAFAEIQGVSVAPPAELISALQGVWGTTALPNGVSGTALASGDTASAKLAKINAWTVAGPNQDVTAAAVMGYLALNGKFYALQQYAKNAVGGTNGATQNSVVAANEVVTLLQIGQGFQMSQPAVYSAVQSFLAALVADPNTGVTANDEAALLALAATTVPWWQSVGGAAPISQGDVAAAGLS